VCVCVCVCACVCVCVCVRVCVCVCVCVHCARHWECGALAVALHYIYFFRIQDMSKISFRYVIQIHFILTAAGPARP